MIGASPPIARPRQIQLGAAFAVLLAAAIILGWRTGDPTKAPPAAAAPVAWELPQIAARDPSQDVAILTARHPWGGGAGFQSIDSPRPPPAAVRPWRLVGVIERGEERLALVLVGPGPDGKLEYRAVGDSLPDGSVLVQIGTDSATSEGGQSATPERRVHRLFDKAH